MRGRLEHYEAVTQSAGRSNVEMNDKLSKVAAHQVVNLLQELLGYIDLDNCHGQGTGRCTKSEQKDCVRKITDYINAHTELS